MILSLLRAVKARLFPVPPSSAFMLIEPRELDATRYRQDAIRARIETLMIQSTKAERGKS